MSLAQAAHRFERKGADYVVRPYEPADRDGFLAVYEAVQGFDLGAEWFDATYVDVPHLDHVPVFVVEADGEIVGVRPYTPFRVRGGDEEALALLSRDTIVVPEHRRRGLFTTATEYSLAFYENDPDSDVAFVFSHSNANSRPGYRKMGWRYPSWRVTHYRLRDPTAFVAQRLGPRKRPLAALPGFALRAYVGARDALRRDSGGEFEIRAVDGAGAAVLDTLAGLHAPESGRPDGVHPVFDATTLSYLLDNVEYTPLRTYVASDGGDPVAALAVHPRRYHGTNWLSVVHVAPLTGGDRWERALSALLGHLVAETTDAEAYRVAIPFPERVLAAHGFLSDRHAPMSLLEPPLLKLGIRPVGDSGWDVGGAPLLAAADLWHVAG